MTTTPTPPIIPPDDAEQLTPEPDDLKSATDSAEADRQAAQGEEPPADPEVDAEAQQSSAEADYDASMGERRDPA